MSWGQKIRARRLELGLSPTQLAARVGISATQLHRIEAGECAPVDATRMSLARELNVQVEELFAYPAAAAQEVAAS